MLNSQERETLLGYVVSSAQVMGTTLTVDSALMVIEDLSAYPLPAILQALQRCRREITGRLTLAAIIERIDDGHLPPSEAWATAIASADESATVVWSTVTQEAYHAAARALMAEGDKVAARMAFIEAYGRRVREERAAQRPAKYVVSLGFDAAGRESVIRQAVEAGRLPHDSPDYLALPPPPRALPPAIAQELAQALALPNGGANV